MAMLCIVSFTGCDMTEEPSGPVTVIDYEFDRTYITQVSDLELAIKFIA